MPTSRQSATNNSSAGAKGMTPEQLALSNAISQSIPTSGRACAGTGKTTTAIAALQMIKKKTLACAFNKSAQMELQTRLQSNQNVETKTLNGLGHRMAAKALGHRSLKLDPQKLRVLSNELFADLKFEQKLQIQKLTREARIAGIVPKGIQNLKPLLEDTQENWQDLLDENLEDETIDASRKLLIESIQAAQQHGEIDFDDQIYLSALSHNLVTDYQLVVVDEAQDLNPLQHKMLQKFYRTSICIIGDQRQCHPAGTLIWTPYGQIPIEKVKVGLPIVTYHNHESTFVGANNPRRWVENVATYSYTGDLFTIQENLKLTHNHKILARLAPSAKNYYAIYLMHRNNQYRLGMSRLFYQTQGGGFGPAMRARQEKADKIWLLKITPSSSEARTIENIYCTKYNIPQILFQSPSRKIVEQEMLNNAWAAIGNNIEQALACLNDHDQHLELPLWEKDQNNRIGTRGFIAPICAIPNRGFEIIKRTERQTITWAALSYTKQFVQDLTVYGLTVTPNSDGRRLYIANNIVVHNSIYGFRGAVSNSMMKLEEKFQLKQLPLTVNFRCAPQIIAYAQTFCPEIQAGLTIQGTVDHLNEYELEALPSEAAILCRCNAPLLRLCFQLINAGRWPKFLGRDIGKSLISVINQITKKRNLHEPALTREIHSWFSHQIQIAKDRNQDHKIESFEDRRDCLFAVLEQTNSQSSEELINNLKTFSEREGAGITLSSIHRAKGLEWPTVFWLNSEIGQKFERKALEKGDLEAAQQERNLSYVATTRAKNNLFFIQTQKEQLI